MALDEGALRRSEFDEVNSVPVVLADGQQWYFPKPWLQIHATFQNGRAVQTCPVLTYGSEIDDLIKAIGECQDNTALLMGAASLAGFMLTANYRLSDEALNELLAIRIGDRESWSWVKTIMDIATGQTGSRSFHGGNA